MAAVGRLKTEQREWITPDEQLDRLPSPVFDELIKKLPIPGVAKTACEYAIDSRIIDIVSEAFEVLRKINLLPDRIPALPKDMYKILGSKCPIYGDIIGSDGTYLKIWQTHSLYLIPSGTLNELGARVSAYGQEHLMEYGGNPFNVYGLWGKIREEHGETRFDNPQWILMSNHILPKSRNQSYEKQAKMVEELSEKTSINYEVPSLRAVLGTAAFLTIANQESILQAGNERNRNTYTYTRVRETIESQHLAVGGSNHSGINVMKFDNNSASSCLGIMAIWKC